MSAVVLYTPEVLGLAIELAAYSLADDLAFQGEARSKSCGSAIVLGLTLDAEGAVERVGVKSHACAIGQASAAIFAQSVRGMTGAQIRSARDAIAVWLDQGGATPDWPGLETIAAARAYPARHGAVMLPWTAATQALSTG
ncbi:iron-sulfur cluster assembly scaffold protein [Novosphingobium sp. Leaf2]|uniref:iron-sulfur cluster assembly scaffold protein n=1 Tax=Novosphingobium sp. Leaf2 TaxID=1735670 RepID=UPI0006FC1344|nr:iron-sulfur cluster assembly scaffold protein [Novosphingobium sp. Leaf2]KQM17450.1 Fe-S cluster protein [Novosphingobium sp. Leaf2]